MKEKIKMMTKGPTVNSKPIINAGIVPQKPI
jgi:hypothetical protein